MSNLLKDNAYHILGLDTSATQRDIQKRAKEIVKILQIDDVPEYDLDLGVFESFRTEDTVKDAVQKLTSPKKQIKDYFFWFYVGDEVDQQVVDLLKKKDPVAAAQKWEQQAEGDSIKALFYKRNLAILYCLFLFGEHNERYLTMTLNLWHELINSTKFWDAFTKAYKLNDELNTDQEIISDFHNNCPNYLSDLYTELSQEHGNDIYISEFTKVFNIRGEKTEKVIMAPIFHEITDAVEKLEEMKVSEDGDLDAQEVAEIKEHVGKIQDCCNKLIDLGLYDDSQSKTIRDRAAGAIRSIVIDIHNNLDDLSKAEQLLKIAMEFVGTTGMENKLKQDLDQFEQNKQFAATLAPIMELMNEKKYDEAMVLIDTKKDDNEDPEFHKVMDAKKKEVVTLNGVTEFLIAKKEFDGKNWDTAIPIFEKAALVIYENIDLFDVNKEVLDSWLETIKNNVKLLTSDNADQVDEAHNKMKKQIDDAFEERFEQLAIKVLIDSYYYVGLIKVIKERGGGSGWGWSWLWWIIGFFIVSEIFDW